MSEVNATVDKSILKVCTKCGVAKDRETGFYRAKDTKDGFASHCRECRISDTKSRYVPHPTPRLTEAERKERRRLSLKRYNDSGKRRSVSRRYQSTPKGKATNRRALDRYQKTDQGRSIVRHHARICSRRFREKEPLIYAARMAVQKAVQSGSLARVTTLQCTDCNNGAQHYHHHNGYERKHWLDVIPLCIKCHTIADGRAANWKSDS